MVARTLSVALLGMSGAVVEVEAHIADAIPGFQLIGLPDAALSDAKDRVRAAAANDGCALPAKKIVVNLSPASLPKQGSTYDLAIAVAVLAAEGVIPASAIGAVVHLGELSLDGRVRPMQGALPAIVAARAAGYRRFVVPAGNAAEALLVPDVEIVTVASLRETLIHHGAVLEPTSVDPLTLPVAPAPPAPDGDLADVVGNADAVEALVVAAAGGHHLLVRWRKPLLGVAGEKSGGAAVHSGFLALLEPVHELRVVLYGFGVVADAVEALVVDDGGEPEQLLDR